jgi:hypothetical protein
MIVQGIEGKGAKYDGNWRLVMYETGPDGRCSPELRKSDMDAQISEYYEQREKEFMRLHGRLFAGELSPVGFFIELQRLSPQEVAARMRLRPSVVKRHSTPAGFESVPVETLRRYARLFDVAVADFFQFVELAGGLAPSVRQGQGGLVQHVRVAPAAESSP